MPRLMDRDLVSALVLFCIGAVFYFDSGSEVKDWIFPLLATYLILGVAVILLARVILGAVMQRAPDLIDGLRNNRPVVTDLVVFCAIILVYVLVMKGIGFWLSSFLMLMATSIYLTLEKTRHNLIIACAVPLVACVVTYLIFLHVFYVPLPEASWFSSD